jgi:mono/diheme cytochrome c family protein
MKLVFRRATTTQRLGACLMSAFLVLVLAGCSLGEIKMPSPPAGMAADRSAGTVIAIPNPIPHTLAGRDDCFVCHAIGAVDAPAVPPDHEEDVTLCTTCHAVWVQPGIAASAPPAIPHEVMGREDCLVCHKLGTSDAPRIPDNHSGLPSDFCQTCHTPVSEIAGGGMDTTSPAAEAPQIPHGLEGFSACTSCHAEGGSGIPRMPDDHEGRTDDICSACHQPAAEASEMTPTPPAETPTTEATEATETPTAETPTAEAAEATETPSAETPPPITGDPAHGEALFGEYCAICHGPSGEGASIAPQPINDPDLLAELSDEDLIRVMREGVEGKMPARSDLDDQQLLDLVAFMRSW